MDRFHRRYWVLPKAGGVFVESMESSLKNEERQQVLSSSKKSEKPDDSAKDKQAIKEKEHIVDECKPVVEDKNPSKTKEPRVSDPLETEKEKSENKNENKIENKVEEKIESKIENKCENKIENKSESKVENKDENKVENKSDNRIENKSEHRVDDKSENGIEIKSDNRVDDESNNRTENKSDEHNCENDSKKENEEDCKKEESMSTDIQEKEISEIDNDLTKANSDTGKMQTEEKEDLKESSEPSEIKIDKASENDTDSAKTVPENVASKEKADSGKTKTLPNSEKIEPEQKPALQDIKISESKSSSENDKEAKNLSQTSQKIWTIDTKINDSIVQSIKKEPDVKIKKEDKKDNKNKECENKFIEKMFSVKDEKKPNVNIFMPNLCDNINLDLGAKLLNSSDRHNTPNPSIPPDQNWVLHSPLFASILAGNMLFNGPLMSQRDMNGTYFNLPKNDCNNPFGPFLGLQSNALSEQIFKSFGEKPSNQKPWFSILPRMPCDESLISSPQQPSRNSSIHTPHSSDARASRVAHTTQASNVPPGHVASALSNLQMELMNGVPPGFFLHPFLPPQFGPTFQSTPTTCSSHHSSYTSTISHSSPMPDFSLSFNRPPSASTPNSIPTPSATPGPTSHGYATPTSRDSPSPSFAKRLMAEKMTQEYGTPQPIPQGMLCKIHVLL